MKNKIPSIKILWKLVSTFLYTFIIIELLELILSHYNIKLGELKWFGWLGMIILYGINYHIFCCLIPLIWTAYKCRHDCKHDYCKNKEQK